MSKIKFFTPEEKKEFFNEVRRDAGKNSKRNLALFLLGNYCALRVSEIRLLTIPDIQHTNFGTTIFCRRLKGGINNTILVIDPEVSNALKSYLDIRKEIYGDTPYLFPSLYRNNGTPISRKTLDKIMKTYCKSTSIPEDKQHFHVLRHTRAIELGNSGAEIGEIQWWLGHKNIKNTMIYTQFTIQRQMRLYKKLQENQI